jgi:hypothetical protein
MGQGIRVELLFQSGFILWLILAIMLLLAEIGWRIGNHTAQKEAAEKITTHDTYQGALFGVMALLIAFNFSGSVSHFDARRDLNEQESITVSKVGKIIKALPSVQTKDIGVSYQSYVDSRISLFKKPVKIDQLGTHFAALGDLSEQMLRDAAKIVRDTRSSSPDVIDLASRLSVAVDSMVSIHERQVIAIKRHPPVILFAATFLLCFITSFVSGYTLGMKMKRDWILTTLFAVVTTGVIFLMLNLEFPALGMIDFDLFEENIGSMYKLFNRK